LNQLLEYAVFMKSYLKFSHPKPHFDWVEWISNHFQLQLWISVRKPAVETPNIGKTHNLTAVFVIKFMMK